ncbi:hypothetical protein N9V47_09915, partial [Luminiphilus sp.]|nr:hypothetical protein [Luminiphilus sp.]
VSVLSGWGNVSMMIYGAALEKPVTPEPGRIVTMKLGGKAELPSPLDYLVVESPKAPLIGDAETWQLGMQRNFMKMAVILLSWCSRPSWWELPLTTVLDVKKTLPLRPL